MMIFSVFTAWVFGREFSDHTAKKLLALPTSREAIVGAKFVVVAVWTFILTLFCYILGWIVGLRVDYPRLVAGLAAFGTHRLLGAGILTILLLP